ncbi:MAG: sialidase family protein [Acidobacteriota bacterium]
MAILKRHRLLSFAFSALAASTLTVGAPLLADDAPAAGVDQATVVDGGSIGTVRPKNPCRLLDDPDIVDTADGLRFWLAAECEEDGAGGGTGGGDGEKPPTEEPPPAAARPDAESLMKPRARAVARTGGDVQVNDSTPENGGSTSQSETTLARNPNNGTICSVYMDLFAFDNNQGLVGHARSTDGGLSFGNQATLHPDSFGDPVVAWRQADSAFYLSTLYDLNGTSFGVDLWRSSDDCVSFQYVSRISGVNAIDRPYLLVDNHPSSPYSGRIYSGYRTGTNMSIEWSDNGGATWSAPVQVGQTFGNGFSSSQGFHMAVDPAGSGKLYVAFTRMSTLFSTNDRIDVPVFSSTNGGATWATLGVALTNAQRSYVPSSVCPNATRKTLKGGMRHLPTPQIAVGVNGVVHLVYSYDPDGFNTGDVIDVFYRRSTNGGVTWGPELRLNDDATLNDQYHPTVSSNPTNNTVVATWYDRRQDPNNLRFAVYQRISTDGGVTWGPNLQVSDLSTPPRLDDLATGGSANCYHGDYDQQIQTDTQALIQWSDDRGLVSGHGDANVYFDLQNLPNPSCCLSAASVSSYALGNNQGVTVPETSAAFCALGTWAPASWTGACRVDDSSTADGLWTMSTQNATGAFHCVDRTGSCPPSPTWNDFRVYNNDIAVDGDQYAYCALGDMKRNVGGGSCGSNYDAASNEWRFSAQDADCRFLCIRRDAVCSGFATTPLAVDGRSAPANQSVSTTDYAYCAAATVSPSYLATPVCEATLDTVNSEWDLSASGAFCRFLCIDG